MGTAIATVIREIKGIDMTKKVLDYQKGSISKQDILDTLWKMSYIYPLTHNLLEEEQLLGFTLYFHATMTSTIDRFKDIGFKFDTYFAKTIRNKIRSYKKWSRHQTDYLDLPLFIDPEGATTPDFQEEVCDSGAPPYRIERDWTKKRNILFTNLKTQLATSLDSKGLLCVFIQLQRFIPQEGYERLQAIFAWFGFDFYQALERFDESYWKKVQQYKLYQERSNLHYIKKMHLEDLLWQEQDQAIRDQLNQSIDVESERMETANEKLQMSSVSHSHREIAEYLGIPKGSVDSCIFHIKRNFINLLDDLSR